MIAADDLTRPVRAARLIDQVRERLHVVSGRHHAFRARCPVHGSRGGTLSIRETTDGAVLIHCFAGCNADAIVRAIGLDLRDLFPDVKARRRRSAELAGARREFRKAPRETIRAAIEREVNRIRQRLVAENGFIRPLRSAEINAVRSRVAAIYGVDLAPIAPFVWECPPHDNDPAWRSLFERRLREVLIEASSAPDSTPRRELIHVAAVRAARDLRELALYAESA